jgi:hypothetical protein
MRLCGNCPCLHRVRAKTGVPELSAEGVPDLLQLGLMSDPSVANLVHRVQTHGSHPIARLLGGRRVDCLLADVVFPVLEVLLAEGEGHHLQLECGPLFLKPALPVPELRLTIPQLAGTVMEVLLLLRDGAKLLLSAQLLGH